MKRTAFNKQAITARKATATTLGAAVIASFGVVADAQAQAQSFQLEEIVVTAQRRAQSIQDVPVAVTALSPEMMKTNRLQTVNDLSGLAPNVTVRPSAGGVNVASFNIRGITSYGVVPGSDKQVSIYLDGVYIGSPRGSIFELPDIAQLEVLRGPQGTLFGRNATAGAINVTTRDPSGEFGITQEVSVGNRDHLRSRTTLDLPAMGPFSAYLTYVNEERDGDVRNLGGGTVWDRSAFGKGIGRSPDKLGGKDAESFFVSARLDLADNFSLSYKFDHSEDTSAPTATVGVGLDTTQLGPEFGPLIDAMVAMNNPPFATDARRPSVVNNAWHMNTDQKVYGHSLTATWDVADNLTLKNILAYRKADVFTPNDIAGVGGMMVGPLGALLGGLPPETQVCLICSQSDGVSEQWSNELQLNYSSDSVTLTSGIMYFESDESSGGPVDSNNTFTFAFLMPGPNGYVVPRAPEARSYNKAESLAGFAEAEWHLTPQLDLVTGFRLTRDKKWGHYSQGLAPDKVITPFDYSDTNNSYNVGVNYRLDNGTLLYAKHSKSFVSGGNVAGLAFEPEDAISWEVGAKGDFLDGRVRASLAIFDVKYESVQTAQSGVNVPGYENVATLVVPGGDIEAHGAEFELTVLPMPGLTLNGNLGYTHNRWTKVEDLLLGSVGGNLFPVTASEYRATLQPNFTGSLSASYETAPLFNEAYMSFAVTGTWRSRMDFDGNPNRVNAIPQFRTLASSPASWVVNARAALTNIDLGDRFNAEVAIWGRNLNNNDYPVFSLINFAANANYLESRTYGIDLTVNFH